MCASVLLGEFIFLCDSTGLTVEWAEDSLQHGKRISVPEDVYNQGCVKDIDEGLEVNAERRGRRGQEEGAKGPETSHCLGSGGNCLTSKEVCLSFAFQAAEKIGFPLMIKASEGGGGKGIRKAESAEDFPILFRQVSCSCCVFFCMSLGIVFMQLLATRFFPLA